MIIIKTLTSADYVDCEPVNQKRFSAYSPIYTHAHIHLHTHTHTYIDTHVHMTNIHTCLCACPYTLYLHTHPCYSCTHINTHIHIHANTYSLYTHQTQCILTALQVYTCAPACKQHNTAPYSSCSLSRRPRRPRHTSECLSRRPGRGYVPAGQLHLPGWQSRPSHHLEARRNTPGGWQTLKTVWRHYQCPCTIADAKRQSRQPDMSCDQ